MLSAVSPFPSPQDHPQIRVVGSFQELVTTPWGGGGDGGAGINALCWRRTLAGDFGEIVEKLGLGKGITSIDDPRLLALDLTEAGRQAREVILQGLALLHAHDLLPSLGCVHGM